MCQALIDLINSWFKPVVPPVEPPVTPPVEPPVVPLVLPHPEEPANYSQTADNLDAVFDDWLIKYRVPELYYSFWRNQIVIKVDDQFPYPAGTWTENGKRHLTVRPEYFNPGVLAHEFAHVSYGILSNDTKNEFEDMLIYAEANSKLVQYLFTLKPGDWGNPVIEKHAEMFRYLGIDGMPEYLRKYYPRLF